MELDHDKPKNKYKLIARSSTYRRHQLNNIKNAEYIKDSFTMQDEDLCNFEAIRHQIKSFDLIGYGVFMGYGGNSMTHFIKKRLGEVCHVGIAILARDFPTDHQLYDGEKIYVLESTISGPYGDNNFDLLGSECSPRICHLCCGVVKGPKCCCKLDKKYGFHGVMIRDLHETLVNNVAVKWEQTDEKCYGPRFFWCPLKNNNPNFVQKVKITQPLLRNSCLQPHELPGKVIEIVEKYNGRPYDYGCCFLCLIFSMRTLWCGTGMRPCRDCFVDKAKVDTSKAVFCSELCVIVYQDLGLIDKCVNPENALPMDFFGLDPDHEIDHSDLFEDCVAFVP